MQKKSLVLLLVLMLSMAACGKESAANENNSTQAAGAQGGKQTTEETAPEVEFIDGVPVFYSWIHDSSIMEEYVDVSQIDLKTVSFWGYTFDPDEAVEMKLSEFVYDILRNADGSYIFNIGGEFSYLSASQEGKEAYNYNNISAENMTIEDIQADLVSYSEKKEAEEDYDGYYTGEVAIYNSNDLAFLVIRYKVSDGIISDKEVEFIGDENSTIDQDYTVFLLKNKKADVFEGSRSTEDDILIDHSKDGLFTLDYGIEVLNQYGIEATVNEIQWNEEYGKSNLRINFTFTNNTASEVKAQCRDDIVLDDSGEEINTFLVWSEKIPAGESITFDITVKNLSNTFGSIEFAFDFAKGIDHIKTDVFKMSDLTNGMPTITFGGEMQKVEEGFLEKE